MVSSWCLNRDSPCIVLSTTQAVLQLALTACTLGTCSQVSRHCPRHANYKPVLHFKASAAQGLVHAVALSGMRTHIQGSRARLCAECACMQLILTPDQGSSLQPCICVHHATGRAAHRYD